MTVIEAIETKTEIVIVETVTEIVTGKEATAIETGVTATNVIVGRAATVDAIAMRDERKNTEMHQVMGIRTITITSILTDRQKMAKLNKRNPNRIITTWPIKELEMVAMIIMDSRVSLIYGR